MTATLDWSQCPAVESVPGRLSGAWVLRGTRMPISVIFENLEYGSSIEEIIENYNVTREQIQAVLDFAARRAAAPPPVGTTSVADAHTLSSQRPLQTCPSYRRSLGFYSRRVRMGSAGERRLAGSRGKAGFDLLLTADKNMRYQQNLSGRKIALVVLGNSPWPVVCLH